LTSVDDDAIVVVMPANDRGNEHHELIERLNLFTSGPPDLPALVSQILRDEDQTTGDVRLGAIAS
jgi:hypothetical protein